MVKNVKIKKIHQDTLCCEPLLVKGKEGELLCICQCDGPEEPHKDNREYIFRSYDNGDTWTEKERLIPETGRAEYATGVYKTDEEIAVFFSTQSKGWYSPEDWKCNIIKSFDEGATWQDCGDSPVFPNDTFIRTPITLPDGSKLVPYHTYPKNKDGQFDKVETGVLKTYDNFKTFERYPASYFNFDRINHHIWSEPTLAVLSDGTIVMLTRHDIYGYLWRCESKDGGKTWSQTIKTDIPNPTCKSKLFNIDNGRIALVHIPSVKGRYPLCLWISDDDMKTWSEKIQLTNFPGSYHYPDGFYEDGHIKFTIEYDRNLILYFDIEL